MGFWKMGDRANKFCGDHADRHSSTAKLVGVSFSAGSSGVPSTAIFWKLHQPDAGERRCAEPRLIELKHL